MNAADEDGLTALHIAASQGLLDIAQELIARGANVNALEQVCCALEDPAPIPTEHKPAPHLQCWIKLNFFNSSLRLLSVTRLGCNDLYIKFVVSCVVNTGDAGSTSPYSQDYPAHSDILYLYTCTASFLPVQCCAVGHVY